MSASLVTTQVCVSTPPVTDRCLSTTVKVTLRARNPLPLCVWKCLPPKILPHKDPAETQDPLPDQATQSQSLQAPQPGVTRLFPGLVRRLVTHMSPSSPPTCIPCPPPGQNPSLAPPESGALIHIPSGHLHASPMPGPLYLCLLLPMEKPPLLQVSRCLQTLSAVTSIVTVPTPPSNPEISLLYCYIIPTVTVSPLQQ